MYIIIEKKRLKKETFIRIKFSKIFP